MSAADFQLQKYGGAILPVVQGEVTSTTHPINAPEESRQILRSSSRVKKMSKGHGGKSVYKRAFERPPVVVSRRNARERKRVHTVNQAFLCLKLHVPSLKTKSKRVSKLKILQAAINYMYDLMDILDVADAIQAPGRIPAFPEHQYVAPAYQNSMESMMATSQAMADLSHLHSYPHPQYHQHYVEIPYPYGILPCGCRGAYCTSHQY